MLVVKVRWQFYFIAYNCPVPEHIRIHNHDRHYHRHHHRHDLHKLPLLGGRRIQALLHQEAAIHASSVLMQPLQAHRNQTMRHVLQLRHDTPRHRMEAMPDLYIRPALRPRR